MNTRILRMAVRYRGGPAPVIKVPGLGQAYDVSFSFRGGVCHFGCETVNDDPDRPWWTHYPLDRVKPQAKVAFASLERHKALGTKTPAALLLAVLEARKLAEVRSKPRPRPHRRSHVEATA